MGARRRWSESISDRLVDQGGRWGAGREISRDGAIDLPLGLDSNIGFVISNAESLDEAAKLAEVGPVISSHRVHEIMQKQERAPS